MALTLEEAIRQINNNVDTMPKAISMSQAEQIDTTESILNAIPEYRDNKIERFAKGLYAGLDTVRDVLPAIELYGRNADLAIGGYFGASEEEISRKAMNIATIQRNLMANQKDRAEYTSEETAESFAYGLGQGAANLLMMYASGGATGAIAKGVAAKTAVGIATGTALENIEQQSERMPVDKLGKLQVEKITPEWAKKSTIGTTSYLATSALLEKYVGFGKQTTLWETPIKFSNQTLKNISPTLKTAGKGLLSEGATEGLQSLTSSGILLAEGTIKMSEMPERLQQAWKEAVIGGILGGSVGTAVAINQQVNVKTMLNEEIGKVVADPNEREAIVEAIYESGTVELTNVISKELELSSELNTKHGAIYDSMQNAIFAAIEDAGALSEESETDLAQYVSETSKMFANQVLAEANKRGCLIDDVLKASDIKFEDGMIKLQAGNEVIAETPVISEEVSAEIVNQSEASNYSKRKKEVAYSILSKATGKSSKWLRMQLGSNSNKKGMGKRREFIEELIKETEDNIAGSNGMLPEWREFYTYNDGETDADYDLAMQALNDILNDNFEEKENEIDRRDAELAEYYKDTLNHFKEKFDEAKTAEEKFDIYNKETEYISDSFLLDEIVKLLDESVNSLGYNNNGGVNNESSRVYEEGERNNSEASRTNVRTNGKSDDNISLSSNQRQDQEINPDILFQSANTNENRNLIMTHASKSERLDDILANGSLVAPSMAITKKGQKELSEKHFGDILFIRNPELINYRKDNIYDRDIYSPRLPEPAYKTNWGSYVSSFDYDSMVRLNERDPKRFEEMYGRTFEEYFAGAKKVLFDGYTPSGKRKLIDYNSKNLVKWIKKEGLVGGESWHYGLSSFLAKLSLKQTSKKELKKTAENSLQDRAEAEKEYEKLQKEYTELLFGDITKYYKFAGNSYQKISDEDFENIMFAIYRGNDRLLSEYIDVENLPKELYEKLKDFVERASKLPRSYFEAKPLREVSLTEFSYALVEKGTISEKQEKELRGWGIKVVQYEKGKLSETIENIDKEEGNIYFQLKNNPKEPKKARGAYNVSKKAIELFKDADYSTLPHEMAHFWLDNMWSYSRSGLASDAYKNNFQGVLDFLGVKDNQLYLTRAQQEKFARAYEKYLLNGYAPNGLIQGAFDEYDRWLQKVYKDASDLKVKLTADAIEFFDSMTTGELQPYTVEETNREVIEKEVIKTVKEAKKVATQTNAVYSASPMINSTVPVETEGEKAQSRVYTNQSDILGLAEELDYNKVSIEEQNAKAKAFVKANLAAAQRIVDGLEQPPADILKNAIYNAYLKEMLAIGNTEAYVHALRNQSLELTRAGQEIASQRGAIENIFDSTYWIRRIENRLREIKAVEKFGDLLDGVNEENAVNKLNEYIDTEISKVLDNFVNATAEEQAKIVKKLVDNVSAELNSKPPEELYQRLKEPSEVRTKTNAYNYLYRAVNEGLGLSLSSQQVNEIINKTSAIQKSIENTKDRNGNPSALFFKNMAEMENYANSIAPSPALSVLTSTIGRGNMLMSAKSIALNIESNILNFISESVIKRISYGAIDKVVDTNVIKEYLEYSKGVFNSSGYQVSTMDELDATQRILSEKQITSQGDGVIRALGRFYEQTIFKYGLGYPDLIFKDLAFVDSVNLLASKEANGDAKKATAIFKDAILLEPKTIQGKEIRAKAQIDALVATYQNKGRLSDLALGIRNSINKATKQLRLGDVLSPFVKTPANVIGLGIDYTMGAYTLKDINTVINDFQNGRITDTTRKTLQKTGRNAIGVLIAIALSSLIDDEDYIPDYALLSPSERNLIKAKNGVFNSIRIGDKWISLDYFGPFAMPLAAVLNAKREKELTNRVFNYFKGAGIQALKVPVVGDLKDVLEEAGRATNQDAEKNAQMAINGVIDFVSSRSIPALVSDVAKITDDYERDTGKSALNRAMTRIPVIREQLPAKVNYATGRAVETENALSVLLAGARVKEATKGAVIREFDKLANAQTDKKVTLSGVTKGNSLLSKLPESEKPKVEAKFAKMYSSEVSKLIKTNYYNNLDNENKVKAINKIRDKAVESLKKEYGLGKKGVKRK